MQKIKFFLFISWPALTLVPAAQACRYTVREIGFADVYANPYRLYVPAADDFPDSLIAAAQQIFKAALVDANITAAIWRKQEMDSLLSDEVKNFSESPQAFLLSPQGRAIKCPFSVSREKYKQDIWDILEWVCLSPMRKQINEHLADAYCVVLILSGEDESKNLQARKIAAQSVDEIKKIIPAMPKPIAKAPVILELARDRYAREELLLWSLDTGINLQKNPRAAILYGRARRLGPVLENDKLAEQNLLNLLALVGADCECGLDRSWILGSMIPTRWSGSAQRGVAAELGFDVDNPAIRMEMEQILSNNASELTTNAKSMDFLNGYREGIAELMTSSATLKDGTDVAEKKNSRSLTKIFILSFISIAMIISVSAILINWRMKKKNRL